MITSRKGSTGALLQELLLGGRTEATNRPASDGIWKMETLGNIHSPSLPYLRFQWKEQALKEVSQAPDWGSDSGPLPAVLGRGWHSLHNYQVRSGWSSFKGPVRSCLVIGLCCQHISWDAVATLPNLLTFVLQSKKLTNHIQYYSFEGILAFTKRESLAAIW